MKTHILFFDGTENHPFRYADESGPAQVELVREASNVEILCEALSGPAFTRESLVDVRNLLFGQEGFSYYMPGVGSPKGPQDSDLLVDRRNRDELGERAAKASAFLGSSIGDGGNEQIMHAYVELAKRFEPVDKVVAVGFSRGACAARSFCGLLNRCGIQSPESESTQGFARRIWSEYKSGEQTRPSAPVEMCVCFDSVPGPAGVFSRKYHDFNPPNIRRFKHMLSMDENRIITFPYLPWKGNPAVATTIWYPGVHSDVGGGYAKASVSIGPILTAASALLKHTGVYCAPRILCKNHGNTLVFGTDRPDPARNSRVEFLRERFHLPSFVAVAISKGLDLLGFRRRGLPNDEKLHASATYWLLLSDDGKGKFSRAFKDDQAALDYALNNTHDDTADVDAYLCAKHETPDENTKLVRTSNKMVGEVVRGAISGDVVALKGKVSTTGPSVGR